MSRMVGILSMTKLIPHVAVFLGLILMLVAVPEAIRAISISQEVDSFRSTRAQVLQSHTDKHGKGPETYTVKFKYKIGKSTYDGDNYWTRGSDTEESVLALIRKEKDGKRSILVYYDPDAPKRVVIQKDVGILVPSGVIAVSFLLFFAGAQHFLRQRKRQRLINRNRV